MGLLKNSLRAIAPHGLVRSWQARQDERKRENDRAKEKARRAADGAARRQRIAALQDQQGAVTIQGDDWRQVADFLVERQIAEFCVLLGSMPGSSLEYMRENVIMRIEADRPLRALHVGNFIGVSLAFLSATLKRRHPASLVVSIDPNITAIGIRNPQAHVSALLTACGLQRNTMILAGYSCKKNIGNDGHRIGDYDPLEEFANEFACEDTMKNLGAFCPQAFDLILLDGNHDAGYLSHEIQTALPMLKPGGFLVLDDVSVHWTHIAEVFSKIEKFGLKPLGTDGRIGIARLADAAGGVTP